jgi:ABC-2 type transport system ATP-binding protein
MCHRIAIIDKGNLVALDTTQKLLDRIQTKKVTFKLKNFDENIKLDVNGVKFIINSNTSISVVYEKNINKFGDILDYLKNNRLEILDITTEDSDLEDVFVKLTNN